MEIRNVRHKGLRKLIEDDETKGLPQNFIAKIRDIISFLIEIEDIEEVYSLKKYRPHLLTGNRAGTYSLNVSANWRLTFQYDDEEKELFDLDFEDYH
ncbi:MAG: type II toxin-antitoxin system RelE/ParE family toxin [Alphaproteobacteria bacterium]